MEDKEILEKLIELAWANGWEGGHSSYRLHKQAGIIAEAAITTYIGQPDVNHAEGFESVNAIIFDKQFIQDLCKAKYGDFFGQAFCALCGEPVNVGARSRQTDWKEKNYEDSRNGIRINDDWCDGCDSEGMLFVYDWQYHIQQLAISDNRLEYLREQFLS